jgi:prefoldin alpha subunit
MEPKKHEEILLKLGMFEQQANVLQEQIEAIEKGVNELGNLSFGLDELRGGIGREILAPIGRGIFLPATISSETLTVDIGEKKFVKKSISETKEMIGEQIKKLINVKKELEERLIRISDELKKELEE